uniref:pumilio homolog 12-like n=1 Tax=Erigeron canadensis TaxID=72917 RepID=UPI001CB9B1B6|nr:pumilio homolog 12-like [Erigeron canadensis]
MNQTPPPAAAPPQNFPAPPSSFDINQTLSNALFSLNLSESTHQSTSFLPQTLDYEYDHVQGLTNGLFDDDDVFRVSNSNVDQQQGFYSAVGDATPLTMHPHFQLYPHYHHDQYPIHGFDPRFELDYISYLLAKEKLYNNRFSTISDGPFRPRNNSSNYSNGNRNRNGNHSHSGVVNKLPNQQFFNTMSLKDLRGMIYFMAKDQNAYKILKSKIENPTNEEVELVLSEIMGSLVDLMKDQFGNVVIQKLVCVCNDDQKTLIVRELTELPNHMISVCMSPCGTRAVQKLLENMNSPNQIMMVIRALHRSAAKLAIDPNGHHVLQHCLVHFDSEFTQLILDDIANNCLKVATDRSGCCVLQACVEHARGDVRNRLLSEIMANAIHIAEDPFGNYVLQHMVGLKSPELTELLVRQLQGNFAYLSQNKYASNVVEKCLIESGSDVSTEIILELVGSSNPSLLLVDPYGNFVIQSALKVSKGFAHECLYKLISRNVASMQSNLYGKKILEKLEKRRAVHI